MKRKSLKHVLVDAAPVILIAAVVLGIIGCTLYGTLGTVETLTVDVTHAERIETGSGDSRSSKYLVYTSTETFENTDTMLHGKWSSSDLHGRFMSDTGRYRMKVYGYRLPFLSSYRNIIEATKIE